MVTRNEEWFTDNDVPDPNKKDLPIPCGWRMLVRPAGVIKKTKGGIILTDKNLEEQQYLNSKGRVIAMGNECYGNREENWCKINDTIVYSRYAGSKIDIQGVKMILLNDDEVLAVLPNPDAITQNL